jgi:hypothetical protein
MRIFIEYLENISSNRIWIWIGGLNLETKIKSEKNNKRNNHLGRFPSLRPIYSLSPSHPRGPLHPFSPCGPEWKARHTHTLIVWPHQVSQCLPARTPSQSPTGEPHSSGASFLIVSWLARIQRSNPWRSELSAKRNRIWATTSAWNSAFLGRLSHWAPASLNPLPSRGFCRTLESAWGFCSANCAWNRLWFNLRHRPAPALYKTGRALIHLVRAPGMGAMKTSAWGERESRSIWGTERPREEELPPLGCFIFDIVSFLVFGLGASSTTVSAACRVFGGDHGQGQLELLIGVKERHESTLHCGQIHRCIKTR